MADRPQLLSNEPQDKVVDMAELVGIANAIEVEAVARYAQLAQLMDHRGEREAAATFRGMCEFEQRHVDAVGRWATSLHQEVRPAHGFAWRLPQEIGASWDEVRHSSLLTPYRALAIAVTNEERAFAFYAYIAAHAADAEVAHQAEAMAREELAHAAELRVHRRQAYRREHPGDARPMDLTIETVADFHALEQRLEQKAAEMHCAVARALARAGDADGAAFVDGLARREAASLPAGGMRIVSAGPFAEGDEADPLVLLHSALQPLERASEIYEDLIAHAPSEELLIAQQAALRSVVERISSLGARISKAEARP